MPFWSLNPFEAVLKISSSHVCESVGRHSMSTYLSPCLLILSYVRYCRTHAHCRCTLTSIYSHAHIFTHNTCLQTLLMHTCTQTIHECTHMFTKFTHSHINLYRYIEACIIYMLHAHTQTYHAFTNSYTHMHTHMLTHSYTYAITLCICSHSYKQTTHIFPQITCLHAHAHTLIHSCLYSHTYTQ